MSLNGLGGFLGSALIERKCPQCGRKCRERGDRIAVVVRTFDVYVCDACAVEHVLRFKGITESAPNPRARWYNREPENILIQQPTGVFPRRKH